MIIVLFHVFYLLGKLVFYRYRNINNKIQADELSRSQKEQVMEQADENDDPYIDVGPQSRTQISLKRRYSNDDDDDEDDVPIKFSPPAYIQRYQAVLNVLTDEKYAGKLKKIVDFGCAELTFCVYLKTLQFVEEALFVDINKILLDLYKEKTKPLHADYLHKRRSPLTLRVFEGSVTDNDKSLENCDAVVCIELVEHLYPEHLTMLPFNIFGFIRPKVAIITTPNADFNVLFKNMTGFRHPDHKFEWTRKQFQDWAHNIVLRFPEYEVTFQGICNGPSGTEHLGACSQMAVFYKSNESRVEQVPGVEGLFKPVITYEYPYEIDNRSDEEKILDDAVYYIRNFSMDNGEGTGEVLLQCLVNVMKNYYLSLNNLREILENANWTVVDRENGPVVLVPPSSDWSDNQSGSSFREDDFFDDDYPPGEYDWEEPAGPPVDYFSRNQNYDIDIVEEESWENEPYFIVSNTRLENESNTVYENLNTENTSFNTELINNTSLIPSSDASLDDIVAESHSTDLADSTRHNYSRSYSCSSDGDIMLQTNHTSDNVLNDGDVQIEDPSTYSNESVIAESNLSEYSPETNDSESPEKLRLYTGTIPKNFNGKISDTKLNAQKETKLEDTPSSTPDSQLNSWSPEIMDSGYPNSNSPPDLSPEDDLSSIMYNHSSDSESPSIADPPRIDFAEANNNLDGEGNYMEAEENQRINDLHPLINVLENDLENENDIYLVHDGFPVWLLRILQRFDADGVGINLPMHPPQNENFGE